MLKSLERSRLELSFLSFFGIFGIFGRIFLAERLIDFGVKYSAHIYGRRNSPNKSNFIYVPSTGTISYFKTFDMKQNIYVFLLFTLIYQ
jgi:hypothetical protein